MATPISAGSRPEGHTNVAEDPAPKLRDSCQACAASKLKCSKQKPRCARCIKRGINCEYLPTRRAGRKAAKRLDTAQRTGRVRSPTPMTTTAREGVPAQTITSFSDLRGDDCSDGYSSPDLRSESTGLVTPADTDSHMPEFLVASTPFQHADMFDDNNGRIGSIGSSLSDWTLNYPFDNSHMSPSLFGTTTSTFVTNPIGQLHTPPSCTIVPAVPCQTPMPILDHSTYHSPSPDIQCRCHSQAYELIKQFCLSSWCKSTPPAAQARQDALRSAGSIQSTLANNQRAIGSIIQIIACSCSQDNALLAMASIVLFKIIDRYEQVACDPPTLVDTDGKTNTSEAVNDTQQHAILGALHRVRCLLPGLFQRLRSMAGSDTRDDIGIPCSESPGSSSEFLMHGATNGAIPFSATLFRQLQADLHERLQNVFIAVSGQLSKA